MLAFGLLPYVCLARPLSRFPRFSAVFRRNFNERADMKYDEAVRTLNVLQVGKGKPKIRDAACLVAMQDLLQRVSIGQNDMKKLNVIHVSGTKGKGSTCAFVESILRHHGYKTGFFSSPHLIEVRERIRINGQPISKTQFADYFEDLYNRFTKTAGGSEMDYPSYFYFLTVMAFHVFLSHRVDVAIMEVGIGGTFDCTNVVQSPVICGVTPLGYDHMDYLGNTIESIAWHKSGIFKPGAQAFTSPQPYSAMQVMAQTALDTEIKIQICPDLSTYKVPDGKEIHLGLAGDHQKVNASLALQISQAWMRKMNEENESDERYMYSSEIEAFPSPAKPFLLNDTHLNALFECQWGGRAQVLKFQGLTFYLDGAHTVKSMQCCARWFQEEALNEEKRIGAQCRRILVFNATRGRDAGALFRALQDCDITHAVFTPNIATFVPTDSADQTNLKSSLENQLLSAVRNHEEWLLVKQEQQMREKQVLSGGSVVANSYRVSRDLKAPVFATIADAIAWMSEGRDEKLFKTSLELASTENYQIPLLKDANHVQVLVTGSVHLVGGFLRILDPNMNGDS
ncbi:folylpolyglutamate synthase, mitochondrial-like [Styela clava]